MIRSIVENDTRASQLREALGILFDVGEQLTACRFHLRKVSAPPTIVVEFCPEVATVGINQSAVLSALAVRSITTAKSIIALSDLHHGSDALILCRSLFENSITLCWILRNPYVRGYLYGLRLAAYRQHVAREYSDGYESEADRKRDEAIARRLFPHGARSPIWARGCDEDGRLSDKHLTLQDMAKEIHAGEPQWELRWKVEYFSLSGEVHASTGALHELLEETAQSGYMRFSPRADVDGAHDGLFWAALYLYSMLGSLNQHLYADCDEALAKAVGLLARKLDGSPMDQTPQL